MKGVLANRADTLVRVIGDVLLGGDLIPSLIGPQDGIVKTIIDNITGENRYNVLKVLLAYFNDYTVKPMPLEYMSFEKIDYPYETYTDSTTLTSRKLRRAIREHHGDATTIVIAQRVSSIMGLDRILVLDEGRAIGYGTHAELLQTCPAYREIHETQMGEVD